MCDFFVHLILLLLAIPTDEVKETHFKPTLIFSGTHSAIKNERFDIVIDEAAWSKLWEQHRGTKRDRLFTESDQKLSIDFDTHYIVAIFTGNCESCEVIPRIRDGNIAIGFRANFISTEGGGEYDNRTEHEKLKEQAEAPYAFVVLPKPKITVIIEKDVKRTRRGPPLWEEKFRSPMHSEKK